MSAWKGKEFATPADSERPARSSVPDVQSRATIYLTLCALCAMLLVGVTGRLLRVRPVWTSPFANIIIGNARFGVISFPFSVEVEPRAILGPIGSLKNISVMNNPIDGNPRVPGVKAFLLCLHHQSFLVSHCNYIRRAVRSDDLYAHPSAWVVRFKSRKRPIVWDNLHIVIGTNMQRCRLAAVKDFHIKGHGCTYSNRHLSALVSEQPRALFFSNNPKFSICRSGCALSCFSTLLRGSGLLDSLPDHVLGLTYSQCCYEGLIFRSPCVPVSNFEQKVRNESANEADK